MRISKVTTKTGDGGKTRLGDGREVSKSDLRIKCLGVIDELNSTIGFSRAASKKTDLENDLLSIQNQLMNLGGEISTPSTDLDLINDKLIKYLEDKIDSFNSELEPLKEFIIPGDDEFSARINMARSVCRRAETMLVELGEKENSRHIWIKYLNRLSDFLFVMARYHLNDSNIEEQQWDRSDNSNR